MIPVQVSEKTLRQLNELNAREGCPGRSDLELLSDMIRNIVDLTHETFVADVAEETGLRLVK